MPFCGHSNRTGACTILSVLALCFDTKKFKLCALNYGGSGVVLRQKKIQIVRA
jgi:hypothetical protein